MNSQQDIASSNSICNHTCDPQIRLLRRCLPIFLITREITDPIGLHSVLLPFCIPDKIQGNSTTNNHANNELKRKYYFFKIWVHVQNDMNDWWQNQ